MSVKTTISSTTPSRKAKIQTRLSADIHTDFAQLICIFKVTTSLSNKTWKCNNTSNNGIRLIESPPFILNSISYTIDINLKSNSVKFSISPVSSANSLTIFITFFIQYLPIWYASVEAVQERICSKPFDENCCCLLSAIYVSRVTNSY